MTAPLTCQSGQGCEFLWECCIHQQVISQAQLGKVLAAA